MRSLWVRRRLKDPVVRLRWDARLLRRPLIGDLVTKVETARFARTLATLLANGVTLLSGSRSSRRRSATPCSRTRSTA